MCITFMGIIYISLYFYKLFITIHNVIVNIITNLSSIFLFFPHIHIVVDKFLHHINLITITKN